MTKTSLIGAAGPAKGHGSESAGVTRAGAIVIGLRLIVPITILRWPLNGAIVSAILDAVDVVLVDLIARFVRTPAGFGARYAQIDKWLDAHYLAVEAVESRRWPETLERRIALALVAHRLVGVAAFEVTGNRRLLIAFPNLFENFYWYVLVRRLLRPGRPLKGPGEAARVLTLLLIPKLAQEWILHVAELHPWQLIRSAIGRLRAGTQSGPARDRIA
jgi:hypothetical protein